MSPNRLSQHSEWTDFSFGSGDDRDGAGKSSSLTPELGDREPRPSRFAQSVDDYSLQESSFEDLAKSQTISPFDTTASVTDALDESMFGRHQLPELEIGSASRSPYLTGVTPEDFEPPHSQYDPREPELLDPVPHLPDHEPPPPPTA